MKSGKICPQCGTRYEGDHRFCTLDGASLVAENPDDSLIGTVIAERYHIVEKLGAGGMGEVYLAEHVRIRRKVAVKVMRKWLGGDAHALGRFHREAENASQITHPNVATIYDFGETGEGLVYLAMEFIAGEPLSAVLEREGRLGLARAVDIIHQTADALAAAHAHGILHRDLKPDNVMLGRTRVGTAQVKLVDFGISRVMNRKTQQFTSTGLVIGTPDYMSPEQLSGDELDHRTDLYALGLIAFRMLTGAGAFGSGTGHETMVARMAGQPRSLASACPDIPWSAAAQEAFDRALAPDPASRFDDVLTFATALDHALATLPRTAEDAAYLTALAQRSATPARGQMTIDALTPPKGSEAVSIPTPPQERMTEPPYPVAALVPEPGSAPVADAATIVLEPEPVVGGAADSAEMASVAPAHVGLARPRRPSGVLIGGGVVAIAGVAALLSTLGGDAPSLPAPVPARDTAAVVMPVMDTMAPAAAPAETTLASVGAPANINMGEVLARAARGVFAVSSTAGHGVGFLADTSGLVITVASLVPSDRVVYVQVDGERRYRAPVVSSVGRLAAVLLPSRVVRGVTPLPIMPPDAASLAQGDSIYGIGSPEHAAGRRPKGVVRSADSSSIAATVSVDARHAGAPFLSHGGGVVAVASRSGQATQLQSAATLRTLLARAQAGRSRVTADTMLQPTWPTQRVGSALLDAGRALTNANVEEYRVKDQGFHGLIMTPQVIAWRRAAADSAKVLDNLFGIDPAKPSSRHAIKDPIQQWSEWNEYTTERRAVVMIELAPEETRPPYFAREPIEFKKGNYLSMTLRRDDAPVARIEEGRYQAVVDPVQHVKGKGAIHNAGVHVYAPAEFATGRRFELEVTDARGRTVRIRLPDRAIEAVRRDLAGVLAGVLAR